MAEENDQNAVQPQNDEQQTVPMPSVDAEQTQTYAGEPYAAESATEPIDVQGGIEDQPTAAMPVAERWRFGGIRGCGGRYVGLCFRGGRTYRGWRFHAGCAGPAVPSGTGIWCVRSRADAAG